MNPYAIIAAIALVLGLMFGSERFGHSTGLDEQKVADQAQFDTVNKQLADNKTEANGLFRAEQAKTIAALAERDTFKNLVETNRAKNTLAVNDLRAQLATRGLSFHPDKIAGRGDGGGSAPDAKADTSAFGPAADVLIPELLASNLRLLSFNADVLNVQYKACYADSQNQLKE